MNFIRECFTEEPFCNSLFRCDAPKVVHFFMWKQMTLLFLFAWYL